MAAPGGTPADSLRQILRIHRSECGAGKDFILLAGARTVADTAHVFSTLRATLHRQPALEPPRPRSTTDHAFLDVVNLHEALRLEG